MPSISRLHRLTRTSIRQKIGVLAVALSFGTALIMSPADLHAASSPPNVQSMDGVASDAAWLANHAGVTTTEAQTMLNNQQSFSAVLVTLRKTFAGQFADAWIEYKPYSLSVSFVGAAPAEAGRLFDAVGLQVNLVSGAPMSETSLEALQAQVTDSLEKSEDFDEFSVTFDAQSGFVIVTLPESSRDSVLPAILKDEHVTVTYSASSITQPRADVKGGARLLLYGGGHCTAGFSVENGNGTGGIVTAGHCENVRYYKWMNTGLTTPTTWMNTHIGQWGDVRWVTTPDPEVAEFHTGTGVREVYSTEQTDGFARGNTYCYYGQTSGYNCSTVWRIAGDCQYDGEAPARHMVIMNDAMLDFGDSGGPWFITSTAAGISSGDCAEDGKVGSAFSKAAVLQEAMGIHVRRR